MAGQEHITTKRGRVQRFTRQHADEFSAKLRSSIRQAEISRDPLCYSDQSGTFSTRTTLMRHLGGKERIQPISHVEVRAFDAREATRYRPPGNWYAPLLVLREEESLALIRLNNVVPAMSDPLSLGIYLENWRNSGFELPSYHIELLLTDFKVDQFIACVTDAGLDVVIDPILSESDDLEVVRGYPIYSLPMLEAMRTTAQ
ncbi:hypothetical protein [Rhizobium sp. C4]|uniref:hypothetical protein n=1 Tax=Rhizobium sp. C4 TaxID=1349800 RepID=UPI001E4FD407|nr:hypothetical protein [Rhizobium sp. C4]MCD2175428.1 hypothetical protein [Rhizobium sp. C4]